MASGMMSKAFSKKPMDDMPMDDTEPDAAEEDSELPPDFESAYAAYEAEPSAQTFWDAVEACTAGGTSIGIALPIGKGKK